MATWVPWSGLPLGAKPWSRAGIAGGRQRRVGCLETAGRPDTVVTRCRWGGVAFFEGCARIGKGGMARSFAPGSPLRRSARGCDEPRSRKGCPGRPGKVHSNVGLGGRCRGHGESRSPNPKRCESCPAGTATCPERFRPQTVEGVRNPAGGSRPAACGGGRSSTLLRRGGWVGSGSTGSRTQSTTRANLRERPSRAEEPPTLPATEGRGPTLWKASRRRVEEDAKSMRGASLAWSTRRKGASRLPLEVSRQR
jgi:hypothetical protein